MAAAASLKTMLAPGLHSTMRLVPRHRLQPCLVALPQPQRGASSGPDTSNLTSWSVATFDISVPETGHTSTVHPPDVAVEGTCCAGPQTPDHHESATGHRSQHSDVGRQQRAP